MGVDSIQLNREYEVHSLTGGDPVRLRFLDINQRNWSRVGLAEYQDQSGVSNRCFVKQYLDKTGKRHQDHWDYEKDGALLAGQLLSSVVRVPTLKFCNKELLLNVFEFIEMVSIDILLRDKPDVFQQCIGTVIRQMQDVLLALEKPAPGCDIGKLAIKRREYGQSSTAVNFKGFEIRNAGLSVGKNGTEPSDLVLFDFVRPYLAPIEEAAAKLFVSIGLLNWGHPLSRFIKGPDKKLLRQALTVLKPWLNAKAVSAELNLQEKFRTTEFKGASGLEVLMKKKGVDLLGGLYLCRLRKWCKSNLL